MALVKPYMIVSGNTSVLTSVPGSNYSFYPSNQCYQLTIVNNTGTDLEVIQNTDPSGITLPVPSGTVYPFYGIKNTSEIGVRRVDQSNTQVTVKARWEG
jgi:hypothetical protein